MPRASRRRSPTREALLKLLGSPDLCSKRWVTEQYDTLILGNTVEGPGGDAAVVRLGDGPKGLALTTDATERYCEADPVEGGKQAVAEAWRNLDRGRRAAAGAHRQSQLRQPEKPEAMGQFVGCLEGIGEAARALDFPIVSGNVSLYNETMGVGIPPTPAIGGVGLVADVAKAASLAFKRAGDAMLLIGGAPAGSAARRGWRRSAAATKARRRRSISPPSGATASSSLSLIGGGRVERGPRSLRRRPRRRAGRNGDGRRHRRDNRAKARSTGPAHAFLFGEDQARYVVTATAEDAPAILADARRGGRPGGADRRRPAAARSICPARRRSRSRRSTSAFETWFPRYMDGPRRRMA